MQSLIIDNQVVSYSDDDGLIIRSIGKSKNDFSLKKKTWGSRMIDNQVLSLLATHDMKFNEIDVITESSIIERIQTRKPY